MTQIKFYIGILKISKKYKNSTVERFKNIFTLEIHTLLFYILLFFSSGYVFLISNSILKRNGLLLELRHDKFHSYTIASRLSITHKFQSSLKL